MYQGGRNARFSKIWRALFSCYPCFEIDHFTLSPTNSGLMKFSIRHVDNTLLLAKEDDIDNIVSGLISLMRT